MKKVFLTSSVAIIIMFSCKKETKQTTTVNQNKENTSSNGSEKTAAVSIEEELIKFSWDAISESTIDIGAFPYVITPKGMVVDKAYSKSYEFDKLELFNGASFFLLEGKVERIQVKMEEGEEFQDYFFQKSVSEYLKSIGAQLIYEGKIPQELTQKWGEDPNAIYEHMHEFYAGDVVNMPVRFYVLKTASKRIGFQVSSKSGTIGIVQSKDFKQNIKKIQ